MNYRIFSLSALVFLAACNDGHESTSESTFAPPTIEVAGTPATPVVVAPPSEGALPSPVVVAVVPPVTGTAITPVVIPPVAGTVTPPVVAIVPPAEGTLTPPEVVTVAPPTEGPKPSITQPPVVVVPVVPEYKTVAAAEKSLKDANVYGFGPKDALDRTSIDEIPSVKHNKMMIKGKEVNYTATAGHLIAKLPDGTPNADQAAVFYMAYTRDDLPRKDRPVTFFWNGGPGSSSIFLHMGSWAPKRVKTGMPVMPAEAKLKKPDNFPLIDNEESMLDHSDLVFVDPVGTGLSQAIKPHKNIDFWGMDEDAALLRDFITRYINVNQRQSSPKYLYGESYGGIRTPVVAKLMLKAGTSSYAPDPSGEKAIAYSGMVLNSPILDYNSNCEMDKSLSCAGFMPSYGMTADYYKKGTMRGTASAEKYVDTLRAFTRDKYSPAFQMRYVPEYLAIKAAFLEADFQYKHFLSYGWTELEWQLRAVWKAKADTISYGTQLAKLILKTPNLIGAGPVDDERKAFIDAFMKNPYQTITVVTAYLEKAAKTPSGAWAAFVTTLEGSQFLADMTSITGINLDWAREFDISVNNFKEKLLPGESMNPYEARLSITKGAYDITFYEDLSFHKSLNTVLTDVFDFQSNTPYKPNNFDEIIKVWKYRDSSSVYAKSSLPDIVETLGYAPSAKILVLHGYYDLVTPFHQTELDLINMKLDNRIPVKNYEGGHMTYESEEARVPMKQELDSFYTTPLSSANMTQ